MRYCRIGVNDAQHDAWRDQASWTRRSVNFMMMVSALVLTGWQSMISKMSSRSSIETTTLSVCLMVRSTIIESCVDLERLGIKFATDADGEVYHTFMKFMEFRFWICSTVCLALRSGIADNELFILDGMLREKNRSIFSELTITKWDLPQRSDHW